MNNASIESEQVPGQLSHILRSLSACATFEEQFAILENISSNQSDVNGEFVGMRLLKIDSLQYAWGPYSIVTSLPMYSSETWDALQDLHDFAAGLLPKPIARIRCQFEMDLLVTRYNGDWEPADRLMLLGLSEERVPATQFLSLIDCFLTILRKGYYHYGAFRSKNYWAINPCTKEVVIPTWDHWKKCKHSWQYREQLESIQENYESVVAGWRPDFEKLFDLFNEIIT